MAPLPAPDPSRRFLAIALALALAGALVPGFLGWGVPLTGDLQATFEGHLPILAWALLGVAAAEAIRLEGEERRRFLLVAGALEVVLLGVRGALGGALAGGIGPAAGAWALGRLAVRWLRGRGRERREAGGALVDLLGLALFPLYSRPLLELTGRVRPEVLDPWVARADRGFGFEAAQGVARFFEAAPLLVLPCALAYAGVLAAMAVVWALRRRAFPDEGARTLASFLLLGVAGYACYLVFPVVGPVWALPGFPEATAASLGDKPVAMDPSIPRNCMPSLHTAWALAILFRTRGLPRAVRGAAVVFLGCTILATLGFGFHYLLDLVVAVPFAVAVDGLVGTGPGGSRWRRMGPGLVGIGVVVAWLVGIGVGWRFLEASPLAVWLLAAVTLGVAVVSRRRLLGPGCAAGR